MYVLNTDTYYALNDDHDDDGTLNSNPGLAHRCLRVPNFTLTHYFWSKASGS
jgi:hypothetical protein